MGHVFVAELGVAHTAGREPLNLFLSGVSVVHVNCAIEDHENLRSIVDVPVKRIPGCCQNNATGARAGPGDDRRAFGGFWRSSQHDVADQFDRLLEG